MVDSLYVWVGDASGLTTTVATSSFGGGGSINTGSFATTGSNVFIGNQTITGSATGVTVTPSSTHAKDNFGFISTDTLLIAAY